jgi:tetratricopeptide (TPR) repeat protein/tRNA A-37 threonylcarbamoyl transferase component Bud32
MEIETRVDDLVDRWEVMRGHGAPLTIDELCADCPELIPEVRRRIEVLESMSSALETRMQEPRLTVDDREWRGRGLSRGLPEVLRATAVYRPSRYHDHGGLGVVFTAQEDELERTVALKRIRPDRHHQAARRRFLREAALTARLQHPGIVPIYGLGQDESGPFYTMPFIQGRTLQEAIDSFHHDESLRLDLSRRSLLNRGLLQQFVAVCITVAYAHDQGVVHRDLKPSNIMLGPYGETLVMDWGLAKRFGADEPASEAGDDAPSPSPSSEDVTATGEVLGTPQYMSPEQAKGEPAGPASDVFSLGLVLYSILTGKPAFDESSLRGVDRLRAVREAAIVPPRRRDALLPRALEAICLKSLAARPEDRYATARALADDVTRWLADEPVTAWAEPVSVRARRWARQHRTAVAAAVVALAALVIGLGSVAFVQARANDQLQRSDDQTKAALKQSEESRKQAEAVTDYLVEAFRSPDPSQDGREVKVAEVLDRAAKRLDEEFAGAQATRGALLHTLGSTFMGLGLSDRAVPMLTKAVAVREAALGADHRETLTSRASLAVASMRAGKIPEAITLAADTLKRRNAALGADDPDALASRGNLAIAYWYGGRTSEAIALLEATLPRLEVVLGREHRTTLTWRNNLGAIYAAAGQPAKAIAVHEVTLPLREATLGLDHPDTLQSRGNLAIAYQDTGRTAEAIAIYEATYPRLKAVLGPDHPDTLANRNNLGNSYVNAGRTSDAVEVFAATLERIEAKLGPDHPFTLIGRGNLALAYQFAGRHWDAITLLEPTLKLQDASLGPNHPNTLAFRNVLALAYESLDFSAEAERLYRDNLGRRRETVPPDSPLLADDLDALGHLLVKQKRWSEAEPLIRESLRIREQTKPDVWEHYQAMSLLGEVQSGQGRYSQAEPLVIDGYEGMKAREAQIPVVMRPRLREAAERVTGLFESWRKPEQATAWKDKLGIADLPAAVFAGP